MANDSELKILAKFDNEVEASIVEGMLRANGIEAGVLGDSIASNLLRGSDKGLWHVVVKPEDFNDAEQLLNTPIEEVDDNDDDDE